MKLDASDISELKPVIAAVVQEVLQATDAERFAFHEPEAAAKCGIERHALRDARRRGEIKASKLGGRVCYRRDELFRWINEREI